VRALLSVANRDGIVSLARELLALDVEVFATDGTREHLAADGVDVRPVSELTGLPTLIGGQVKTFHPAIYAGILARRDIPAQMDELVVRQVRSYCDALDENLNSGRGMWFLGSHGTGKTTLAIANIGTA
jgi:AICAR transformylase/IMP cyclohydrolase PurH